VVPVEVALARLAASASTRGSSLLAILELWTVVLVPVVPVVAPVVAPVVPVVPVAPVWWAPVWAARLSIAEYQSVSMLLAGEGRVHTAVTVNTGIKLVGQVRRVRAMVGGLGRLLRLLVLASQGLFSLANEIHNKGR
jgi:hypothetical protein